MEKIIGLKKRIQNNTMYNKVSDWFLKFISSDLYIIFLFIIAIINWKFRIVWLEFTVVGIFLFIIYLFKITKNRIIPIAVSLIISLRLNEVSDYLYLIIIGSAIILFILIYNGIKKKVSFNNGILIGMILIFISQIFSLINTPVLKESLRSIMMWIFYILIFAYMFNIEKTNNSKNYGRYYISKVFVYLSIAIFLEIILYYLENGIGQNVIRFYSNDDIHFGWAKPNNIAMLYMLMLPIILYYYTFNQKKYYLLLVIAIDLAMLHVMISRGAYLAMILLVIPLLLKTLSDVKEKTNFIIAIIYSSIIILLLLILVAIPTGYVKEFFDFLSSKGPNIEEKELMSSIGFNVFERYPLFGGGVGSSRYYLSIALDGNYYENFLIQTIAETGIVGMLSFGYFLFQMIKISAIKNKFNSYILIIVIAIIIQGLMETTFYNPIIMILFAFIFPLLATGEEKIIN